MNVNPFTTILIAACIILAGCTYNDTPLPEYSGETESSTFISKEKAKENLQRFCMNLPGREKVRLSSLTAQCTGFTGGLEPVTRSGQEPLIYVFNFGEDDGFAVMSATTRMPDVLALAESGRLDLASEQPDPAMSIFVDRLKGYVAGYDTIVREDNDYFYGAGDWEVVRRTTPMCQVKWDQIEPYNQFCPIINGRHAPTSCGIVAMAQALSVFEKPTQIGEYSFNWSIMNSPSPTADSNSMTARLMAVLGEPGMGDVQYGEFASGIFLSDVEETFHKIGYDNVRHHFVDSIKNDIGGTTYLSDYDASIATLELLCGRPVIVMGAHSKESFFTNRTSHIWLLHGYLKESRIIYYWHRLITGDVELISTSTQTAEYVLCNWGWSGLYDGYYLNDIFDTTEGPIYPDNPNEIHTGQYYFQYHMRMLKDIRPNE